MLLDLFSNLHKRRHLGLFAVIGSKLQGRASDHLCWVYSTFANYFYFQIPAKIFKAFKIKLLQIKIRTCLSTSSSSACSSRKSSPFRAQYTNQFMHQVVRIIDIPFQYQLAAAASWTPYPQLQTTFELDTSQYLIVNVIVCVYFQNLCTTKFRILIDGVQIRIFRRQFTQSSQVALFIKDHVWLTSGTHRITLEYIKTGTEQLIFDDKRSLAILKLEFLKRTDKGETTKEPGSRSNLINVFGQMGDRKSQVEPNYPISFKTNNAWHRFPQLQTTVHLQTDQNVYVSYKTTIAYKAYDQNCHFVSRVIIDDKEYQMFRFISGMSTWNTNQSSGFVFLKAGRHHFRVQYRTPGEAHQLDKHDWVVNYLKVKY